MGSRTGGQEDKGTRGGRELRESHKAEGVEGAKPLTSYLSPLASRLSPTTNYQLPITIDNC